MIIIMIIFLLIVFSVLGGVVYFNLKDKKKEQKTKEDIINENKSTFSKKTGIAQFLKFEGEDSNVFLDGVIYENGKFGLFFEVTSAFYDIALNSEKNAQSMTFANSFGRMDLSDSVTFFMTSEKVDYNDLINKEEEDLDAFGKEYAGFNNIAIFEMMQLVSQEHIEEYKYLRNKSNKRQIKYYVTYVASPRYKNRSDFPDTEEGYEDYLFEGLQDVHEIADAYMSSFRASEISYKLLKAEETIDVIGNQLNQTLSLDYVDVVTSQKLAYLDTDYSNTYERFISTLNKDLDLTFRNTEYDLSKSIANIKNELNNSAIDPDAKMRLETDLMNYEKLNQIMSTLRVESGAYYLDNSDIDQRIQQANLGGKN